MTLPAGASSIEVPKGIGREVEDESRSFVTKAV